MVPGIAKTPLLNLHQQKQRHRGRARDPSRTVNQEWLSVAAPPGKLHTCVKGVAKRLGVLLHVVNIHGEVLQLFEAAILPHARQVHHAAHQMRQSGGSGAGEAAHVEPGQNPVGQLAVASLLQQLHPGPRAEISSVLDCSTTSSRRVLPPGRLSSCCLPSIKRLASCARGPVSSTRGTW